VPRPRDSAGQASVELVAVMPLVALLCGALWQAAVAGQALWLSGTAARAAARAVALGDAAAPAARSALPRALAQRASASTAADGAVTVRIRVPAVIGPGAVGTVSATASLPRQR
jgi:hypothetical protein